MKIKIQVGDIQKYIKNVHACVRYTNIFQIDFT